jgi:hypothetical protein
MAARTTTAAAPVPEQRTPRDRLRAVREDLRFAAGVIFDAVRGR